MLRIVRFRWQPVIAFPVLLLWIGIVEFLMLMESAKAPFFVAEYNQWKRIGIWVGTGVLAILFYCEYRQGPKVVIHSEE